MDKLFKRITDWEHWPFNIFYFPLFFVWAWYCLKSRSLWFFSTSNPTLTFGGFEGESKSEMYQHLPKDIYPPSFFISPTESFPDVLQKIKDHKFSYPFIVKPDVGMKGLLFRKIDRQEQLQSYHQKIPVNYIIQELIEMPVEVSIFYYRFPNASRGHISAFIQKDLLQVKGDGQATIRQLIMSAAAVQSWTEEIGSLDDEVFSKVLVKDEVFYGSYIANRYHGARFQNLGHLINEQLLQLFDQLSYNSQFSYGRYDIKCVSAADIKTGSSFSIMEFNGAGSIPNHIYTGGFTLLRAYQEISRHWKILYEISAAYHRNGLPYWDFNRGYKYLKEAKKHFRVLEQLDKTIP